jgi:hypothetical protein
MITNIVKRTLTIGTLLSGIALIGCTQPAPAPGTNVGQGGPGATPQSNFGTPTFVPPPANTTPVAPAAGTVPYSQGGAATQPQSDYGTPTRAAPTP